MKVIKESAIYKMTRIIKQYFLNSTILNAFARYRKTSRILGWFVKSNETENHWINGSMLFVENDKDMIKAISKETKSISQLFTIPFIANSYVVNLLLTFLECEADDRNS